jgi:FtsP/CotA-like multicopper oxidase with cupredoxin domain
MYHTHLDDIRQQSHGLYGPLIVVDSAKSWDPSRDFSFMASIDPTNAPLLNGTTTPPALSAETGTSYRIRLMNLTLTDAYASFSLVRQGPPPRWTPRAKDGYDLPPDRRTSTIARQQVTIGETRDFEMTFPAPGDYSMRLAIGRTVISQVIHVVAR